jgi:exodeoxyribonuclease III
MPKPNSAKKLNLITWNVNGIRAITKKGFLEWFDQEKPDILCVQETKADHLKMQEWWQDFGPVEIIDSTDDIFGPVEVIDLDKSQKNSVFQDYRLVWHSCSIKKGYSGTAIFYKKTLGNVVPKTGIGVDKFDDEGRTTMLELSGDFGGSGNIVIINSYYPQGGRPDRIPYKLEFYEEIIRKVQHYQSLGKKILLCGDLNTTVADIDLARFAENRKTTGCLPNEREVLNRLIEFVGIDSFRFLNPEVGGKYTYWDQITRARDRNVGWRIDYWIVDKELINNIVSIDQLDSVMGSDHCPVRLVVEI